MDLSFLLDPFQSQMLPVGEWAQSLIDWLVSNYRDFFQALKQPIDIVLTGLETILRGVPPTILIVVFGLLGWQVAGPRVGVIAVVCLFLVGAIGAWPNAMTTLAIILTAVLFCIGVGIPMGILAARSDRFEAVLKPCLDFLQTIPSFVYLVPVVMLFGIGNVPGVIVTIVYALAPIVRLTNLGIRQVRADMVEASVAFGGNRRQTMWKVQLPLALPTIMTGVNQTIMMSLAMSVVASMISVTGLGQMVLRGIGRLDMSIATTGGLGIVLLAIVIDRVSQGFGRTRRDRGRRQWFETGPVGILRNLLGLDKGANDAVRNR
ncbi:ABC transporter permease [Roseovarius indicus]|uniref:ABC transporter permease n=1 Tax=Roseovarius indicus TaxID=540747 RepID=UPI0007D91438|nr:ABC transporter permease subunit [Roseovarius indicus]OAO07029.1 glycine/betaine ABC transporter permease [Roseovarius indicus]